MRTSFSYHRAEPEYDAIYQLQVNEREVAVLPPEVLAQAATEWDTNTISGKLRSLAIIVQAIEDRQGSR